MALMRFHRRWQRRPTQSYRLVVTTSDLARQRSLDLPWDLEPVTLRSKFGISALADGSLLRSYPIEIFDRGDGKPSRWPTLGIRLSSPSNERAPAKPVIRKTSTEASLPSLAGCAGRSSI